MTVALNHLTIEPKRLVKMCRISIGSIPFLVKVAIREFNFFRAYRPTVAEIADLFHVAYGLCPFALIDIAFDVNNRPIDPVHEYFLRAEGLSRQTRGGCDQVDRQQPLDDIISDGFHR